MENNTIGYIPSPAELAILDRCVLKFAEGCDPQKDSRWWEEIGIAWKALDRLSRAYADRQLYLRAVAARAKRYGKRRGGSRSARA